MARGSGRASWIALKYVVVLTWDQAKLVLSDQGSWGCITEIPLTRVSETGGFCHRNSWFKEST